MFMTIKTHKRLLVACMEKLESATLIKRKKNQDALDAERLVSDNLLNYSELLENGIIERLLLIEVQHKKIADMQHFYNKGRAAHSAHIRSDAKKRAAKIKGDLS